MSELGARQERFGRLLERAQTLLDRAEARCQAAKRSGAKRKLSAAKRRMHTVLRVLRVKYGTRTPPILDAEQLADATRSLLSDTRTLGRFLACP